MALPLWLAGQTSAQTKLVILLIGPPGSGKTTQAGKLSRKYQIPSISMADILKKEGGGGKRDRRVKLNLAADVVSDAVANPLI